MNKRIMDLLICKERLLDLGEGVMKEVRRISTLIDREIAVEERKQLTGIDDEHIELLIDNENRVTKLN
jgi:hypothetical protein